jgi:hypothetical protein
MNSSLIRSAASPAPRVVWLLLSDGSARRFRAHDFDALIVEDGGATAATWHRIGRDSLRLDWTAAEGQRSAELHETAQELRGTELREGSAPAALASISGRRMDCGLVGRD